MFLLFAFFLLSIIFSFLCSVWEAVLLSIPPSFVEIKIKEGHGWAQLLKEYKENIDKPLSAILTLNTIAHTVGAIGVGAQAANVEFIKGFDLNILGLSITGESLVAVVMTMAILILSEIIPKTIGANNWSGLAGFTTNSLKFISIVLFPFIWVSQKITKALKKDKDKSVLSRTDFTVMAEMGAKEGVFDESEYKVIDNLLKFKSIQADDIMTPRTVVKLTDTKETIQEFYDKNKQLKFSRIPITDGSVDNVVGYLLKDQMLSSIIDGKGENTVKTICRDIIRVQKTDSIAAVFDTLTTKREHIALVVGEYGGFSGIVTTEDIIETLFGMEILDEVDDTADMQQLARENWKKRAKRLGLIEE